MKIARGETETKHVVETVRSSDCALRDTQRVVLSPLTALLTATPLVDVRIRDTGRTSSAGSPPCTDAFALGSAPGTGSQP